MGRGRQTDLPVEWIDDAVGGGGSPAKGTESDPGRRPRIPLVIGALVVAIAAGLLVSGRSQTKDANPPGRQPGTGPPTLPYGTSRIGRPLVAAPGEWDLFGRGRDLVRLQLNTGQVTRTAVPILDSTGPVSFVVGADETIIRPLDHVTGYAVVDGQPARRLRGSLGSGGPAIAGPDAGHLWVLTGAATATPTMRLVGYDGTPTGMSVPLRHGFPTTDGTGSLLETDTTGTYLIGAEDPTETLVTAGILLAVGPTHWLSVECDAQQQCRLVATDRKTGAVRTLGSSPPAVASYHAGVISPDGSTAAFKQETLGGTVLHLLDLHSGRDHQIDAQLGPAGDSDMVWSPDSHLLFFVDHNGRLDLIDADATNLRDLGVALPALSQIALRVHSSRG